MQTPKDIKTLDTKIKAFKQTSRQIKDKADDDVRSAGAITGFQLSIDFISAVIVGAAIGYFLDFLFDTRPILLAILTVLGGAAGVLNMYRSSKRQTKD